MIGPGAAAWGIGLAGVGAATVLTVPSSDPKLWVFGVFAAGTAAAGGQRRWGVALVALVAVAAAGGGPSVVLAACAVFGALLTRDAVAAGWLSSALQRRFALAPLAGFWLYLVTPTESADGPLLEVGFGRPVSPTPGRVARVWGAPQATLWRTRVLDRFDGAVWRASGLEAWTSANGAAVAVVEPGPRSGVYALSPVAGAVPQDGAWVDRDGNARTPSSSWYVLVPGAGDPPAIRHLEVPADIAVQLRPWVDGWTGGLEPRRRVATLTRSLRESGTYDADHPASSLPAFLASRRGVCQHFASALALMLRVSGIPARVVVGYQVPAVFEADGAREVRSERLHAWVEAWVDGAWREFDPTPPAPRAPLAAVEGTIAQVDRWDRGSLREDGTWIALFPLAAAGLWAARARRSPRPVSARTAWLWARAQVARRVGQPPPGLPEVEAAVWLGRRWPEVAESLVALAWASHAVRFGGHRDAGWRAPLGEVEAAVARGPASRRDNG